MIAREDVARVGKRGGVPGQLEGAQAIGSAIAEIAEEDQFPPAPVARNAIDMIEKAFERIRLSMNVANRENLVSKVRAMVGSPV